MRFLVLGVTLLAFALAGCQSAPPASKAAEAESLAAYPGATIETAVIHPDVTNTIDGVRAEHAYTDKHFPNARWSSQSLLMDKGRVYDVIELVENREKKPLYFDISNWFGKM